MKNYKHSTTHRMLALCAALGLLLFAMAPASARIPEPDHSFYGRATVDGQPLFSGTITAEAEDGTLLASYVLPPTASADTPYILRIPIDSLEPRTPGTVRPGDNVSFFIDGTPAGTLVRGVPVDTVVVGERGEATLFDLDTALLTPTPRLSIADAARFEGDGGVTQMVFTVSVSPVAEETVLVEYETRDGTAISGVDYAGTGSTPELLEIAPGVASTTIAVDIFGDTQIEVDESFVLQLRDSLNAGVADGEASGIIRDDDALPVITVADSVIREPPSGTAEVTFRLLLSRPSSVPVTVSYATEDGNALSGLDYTFASGSVTFDPGETVANVPVEILPDSIGEPDEQLFLVLSAPGNAVVCPSAGTPPCAPHDRGQATISDDERFLRWIESERNGTNGVAGLDSAVAVTVSDNGRHVYVAGALDDAIAIFDRAGDADPQPGRLSFLGEIHDELGEGFSAGIRGVSSLAISPDGDYLYAAGFSSSAVAVFDRNRLSGTLSYVDSTTDGEGGADGLAGAISVIVSPDPDGHHVYVAAAGESAISIFTRNDSTGRLTYRAVVRDGDPAGSGDAIDGLAGVRGIAISPDGLHVYAAGQLDSGVAVFDRDPATGLLSYVVSVIDGQSDGGEEIVEGLAGAIAVAVSPDGDHVYAVGQNDSAIAVFARDSGTGTLSFLETLSDGVPSAGVPVDGLARASSVAVAPDGAYVYATGFDDDAVAVFARDVVPTSPGFGRLEFVEARRNGDGDTNGDGDCNAMDDDLDLCVAFIARPTAVAVSPDGRQVYATGSQDDAITVFAREELAPTNPVLVPVSHTLGVPSSDPSIEVSWSGAADNAEGSGLAGYSVRFDTNPGTDLDGTLEVPHTVDPHSTVSADLADGTYYFHLKTCDRSGNCAPTVHLGPFVIDPAGSDGDGDGVSDGQDAFPADPNRSGPAHVAGANVTDNWTTVNLPYVYQDPVVIVGPPTQVDASPGVVRIRNIGAESFQIRFEEWQYLDTTHGTETAAYLVMERGRHTMADGSVWELGSYAVSGTGDFVARSFEAPFSDLPALLLTPQTSDGFQQVVPRARGVTASGFTAALFEEQALMDGHIDEIIGYLAVYIGRAWGDLDNPFAPSVPYLIQRVEADQRPVPVLSWSLTVQEEQSEDAELFHTTEQLDVMAIGQHLFAQEVSTNGVDTAALRRSDPTQDAAVEWGTVSNVTNGWKMVPLAKTYENPVVIAGPASTVGLRPGTPRLQGVGPNSFQIRFQDWLYLPPGSHPAERIFYFVGEEGSHTLAGLDLEIGKLTTAKLLSKGESRSVTYGPFLQSPLVFASVQSYVGAQTVTARVLAPNTLGFATALQEEQSTDDFHPAETVGWMAMEAGSGTTSDGRAVQTQISSATSASTTLGFSLPGLFPYVLAGVGSSNDTDPVVLRYTTLTNDSIEFFLQEEKSVDNETTHAAEDVPIFLSGVP